MTNLNAQLQEGHRQWTEQKDFANLYEALALQTGRSIRTGRQPRRNQRKEKLKTAVPARKIARLPAMIGEILPANHAIIQTPCGIHLRTKDTIVGEISVAVLLQTNRVVALIIFMVISSVLQFATKGMDAILTTAIAPPTPLLFLQK